MKYRKSQETNADEDFDDYIIELQEKLEFLMHEYETTLQLNKIELPYGGKAFEDK